MSVARVRGLWARSCHRAYNRWWDAIAVLAGACNLSTWGGETWSGGYSHWRCMRGRGHAGEHRFENYVWAGPGHRVRFDPFPVLGLREIEELRGRELPFWSVTHGRYMIESLASARARLAGEERARQAARAAGTLL